MTDDPMADVYEQALDALVEHGQVVRAGRERLCASCLKPAPCPTLAWAQQILGVDEH